jgi:hypothetical protein
MLNWLNNLLASIGQTGTGRSESLHSGHIWLNSPPHVPVDQVIGYPRFGLTKPGVWVKVKAWDDDPDPVAVM